MDDKLKTNTQTNKKNLTNCDLTCFNMAPIPLFLALLETSNENETVLCNILTTEHYT